MKNIDPEMPIRYWDAKVLTFNPKRKALMIVEGRTQEEAENVVRRAITRKWPEEEIKELIIEPSQVTRAQRRKMGLR